MLILVLNSGSSSIKYQIREVPDPGARPRGGMVDGAGVDADQAVPGGIPSVDGGARIVAEGLIDRIGDSTPGPDAVKDHAEALDRIGAAVSEVLGGNKLDAVGHRVVHGGERFSGPVLINNEITRSIERLNPLAPLHNPANVLGIRAITGIWPQLPQVAVFDTAFHRTLPEHAWRYAVPDELYSRYGIRRYGFHGTSLGYVSVRAARLLNIAPEDFNAVIAHLGNGASVTAVRGGTSIDTSMGFTPLAGLVMGTRSGDIDPSVLIFLLRQGMDADGLDELLNRNSGLTGLAGNNDMRSVVEAADGGAEAARTALAVASYRLAKYVGGYHVAVGGARAIVFTAGIGENSWQFRQLVVDRLQVLGIRLDADANRARSSEPRIISTADSAVAVLVVPTDEERAIAEATAAVVAGLR
ncbi:acetate kinase [Paenarthrobacter sp. PH39-S1]|uniref:acetate/propionate family kinase n=1 Tax=Paenarthrobacter sp. PH39-S1 TaxID=3046204 RepID=UPI0024BAAA96|nr:acetate kinase [Paenarthrobacter sp. PH39-S1]MDJ0357361.1 acetate kinase [Paenarthrobacter sp. PH39-S1]